MSDSEISTDNDSSGSYESTFDDADIIHAMHELLSDGDGNTLVSGVYALKSSIDRQTGVLKDILDVVKNTPHVKKAVKSHG